MTGILYELHRLNGVFFGGINSNWTLTGYLPSLVNLSSTFPKLLLDNCPGMPPEIDQAFQKPLHHSSEKDEYGFYRAAKQIWNEGGNAARALCALHALDYACFDRITIPDLCMQVFTKKEFLASLHSVSQQVHQRPTLGYTSQPNYQHKHRQRHQWTGTRSRSGSSGA